jgi:serine/threonine-protein kinase
MGLRRSTAETLAASAASFRGERIGKYEILAQLSIGCMAELFLAFTSGPGGFRKYVVVKRILPDIRGSDQFVKMFLDEARITAALNHPNIAHVFDLGEENDGLYLAMEFIAGQNLNQVMEACALRKQQPPLGFIGAVARDVALALHYAHTFTDPRGHSLPVIHRDVAQKNIMVAYDGAVKLLDFGIAKARGSLGRTQVGTVKGTTGYMSPEQVVGQEIDGRSDVFALGVVMHELLTGKRLFAADTEEEEMRKILAQPIPRPAKIKASIPEELSDVVMRALARERADRFNAKELARAIEAVLGKTLFDPDRTSLFMRELFAEKVTATQALLDSVDGPEGSKQLERSLVALRSNDGMSFQASRLVVPGPPAPPPEPLPPPAKKAALPQAVTTRRIPIVGALTPRTPAERPERASLGMRVFWVGVTLLLGATVAVGGYATWDAWHPKQRARGDASGGMRPHDPDAVNHLAPAPTSSALPPISPPGQDPAPALPPSSAPGNPTAGPGPGDAAAPDTAEGTDAEATPAHRAARAAKGKLTLVTHPRCEVYLGRRHLGRTPLFSVVLPAGVHTLHLKGPDGKTRRLSVPIRSGKTAALKISLADLPTR